MQATDLAAVVVAVVSLVATTVLTITVVSLLATMRDLRRVLDTLHDETLPLVNDLRSTIDQAGVDLERVGGILDSAERISSTVDSASQLTYRALSPPLIKTVSFMAGVRSAARRLRGETSAQQPTPGREHLVEIESSAQRARRRRRGRALPSARNSTDRRR